MGLIRMAQQRTGRVTIAAPRDLDEVSPALDTRVGGVGGCGSYH
jgi:hypothetical protein